MNTKNLNRRQFLATASAGTVAAVTSTVLAASGATGKKTGKLAINGGTPVRSKPWPRWPVWDKNTDEQRLLSVMRRGVWSRSKVVSEFESKYAQIMGAKRCLATTNGTHALITSLKMLGVGWTDEVIVGSYTFIATFDAIMLNGALPIFVDTDRETFQINPDKIEEKITKNTKAILPVHILGLPANMDKINAIAKKHNLKVVEDACQAHLAEWKHKKTGTLGDLGCFSFQASKNLPCGEGGAIIGNDDELMDRCYSFHNFGRPYGESMLTLSGYVRLGTKCRMTEYQAAILLAQMKRFEAETKIRSENADYLTSRIKDIPCVNAVKLYDGVTRAVYHMYPFRYNKKACNNMPREKFISALKAEGIPCSGGYGPVNKNKWFEDTLDSANFRKVYSKAQLDRCRQANHCPDNDKLCEETVWLFHSLLLGNKSDMDDIADAIEKIYHNKNELA